MSINPFNTGSYAKAWNYTNESKEGYSTNIIGTVLAIQEVQKTVFGSNPPQGEFWPDGNPKMNIRLVLCTDEGEAKTFTFSPAGREARAGRKRSVHIDLFALTGNTDMKNLIGKTIGITTRPGTYGSGNPRPFEVQLIENMGPFEPTTPLSETYQVERVLADNAAHGGKVSMPQPVYPNGYGTAPQMQAPMQQYQQPQQFAQPMQQMPQYQQPQQPMQQQYQQPQQMVYPQGMDPNVAAAMQAIGAQNMQPYDEGIPF